MKRKRVPMKPFVAWCVVEKSGRCVSMDGDCLIHETKADAVDHCWPCDGETIRRVKVQEVLPPTKRRSKRKENRS